MFAPWTPLSRCAGNSSWHAHGGAEGGEFLGAAALLIAHDERRIHCQRLGVFGPAHGEDAQKRLFAGARNDFAPAHEAQAGRVCRRLHAFALVPGFARHERSATRQAGRSGSAIGLDPATVLEPARRALNTIRFGPGPYREIGWRARDEIESSLKISWLAKIAHLDLGAHGDPIPSEGALGQAGRDLLRLDTDESCVRKPPCQKQQHAPDAAPKIQTVRGWSVRDQAGSQVSGQKIVKGCAMPVEPLQEPPVAGKPAQIFIGARP